MRLKVGFILRSVLVIGTFLGLVLLWSSLTPKAGDDNPFAGVMVKYHFNGRSLCGDVSDFAVFAVNFTMFYIQEGRLA